MISVGTPLARVAEKSAKREPTSVVLALMKALVASSLIMALVVSERVLSALLDPMKTQSPATGKMGQADKTADESRKSVWSEPSKDP